MNSGDQLQWLRIGNGERRPLADVFTRNSSNATLCDVAMQAILAGIHARRLNP